MNPEVIIIGAGPAGIAAAIQLKRYNINFIILEKTHIGGLLLNANLVENYPGFPEGISGIELVDLFKKQLDNAGIQVDYKTVLSVDHCNENFIVKTSKGELHSKVLIIASGTRPNKLIIPEVKDNMAKEILYEINTLAEVKNKKIAIAGAGDCAFDYAVNLSKNNEVIVLNRSNKVKSIPILWEKANINEKISYLDNITLMSLEKTHNKMILNCNYGNDEERILQVDYLVAAIGRSPNLEFIGATFEVDILKSQGLLYTIGDVKNSIYRQTAICTGDGVQCAMQIAKKLEKS